MKQREHKRCQCCKKFLPDEFISQCEDEEICDKCCEILWPPKKGK
jgi:hypothetical protein